MTALRVTFAALVAFASLTASAWWETTVTTNKWEYDGVEYLESSGTQYIDTGVIPKTGFGFNARIATTTTTTTIGLIGCRDTDGAWSLSAYNLFWFGNKVRLDIVGTSSTLSYSGTLSPNVWYNYVFDKTKITINGVTYTGSTKPDASYSFKLFGFSQPSGMFTQCPQKMAYCRLYQNDADVANFVPVVHEGEGKMLDLCHNTLYANAGTGAFSYGSVTGTVTCVIVSTNRVYHANPPQTAYDAASPWNAPERTRIGGDDTTLRPSAIIKEN